MTKSCQELVCVAVEESGRKGFLEEVGQRRRGEGILGWEESRFQDSKAESLSKARCRFGSDI